MSEHGIGGITPRNLRGYKLKKVQHTARRLVLWIIIILVILWFVKREIVLNLFELIKNFIGNLSK